MGRATGGRRHRAPSFKFSSCRRSPSAARAAVEGTKNCAGKGPERQQAARARHQSARKEHNTAGDSAGFQVSATRSERASDPGSGPGLAVAYTQHRVRAAAGCAYSGRPTGTGTRHGYRSAEAPRIKFHGAGISGAPGQRARGADTSSYNSERSCATDISHDGSPSEHRPTGCQISVLSRARKYSRWARAGGPLGAPILLHVYLPTAEATKNGGAGLDL
jgi:hypothetical protein